MNRYFAKLVAAAAIVGILVFLSTKPALSTHTSGGDVRPDLATLPPGDFWIEVVNGKNLLHLRNEVGNNHTGALEIYPEKSPSGQDTDDCDGNGDSRDDRQVYQRIFQDANNDGIYTRRIDKESRSEMAGCMIFHEEHNHWHFNDFALYELYTLQGELLASSSKVTFCVIDGSRPFSGLPGSPSGPHYKSCSQSGKQGLSVGWSDIYRSTTAGQYIDITTDTIGNSIGNGTYCVVSTADPKDRLKEVDELRNNRASTKISLSGNTVTPCPNTNNPCPCL